MAKIMFGGRDDLKEQAEAAQAGLKMSRDTAAAVAQDMAERARPGWEQLQEAIGTLTEAAKYGAREAFVRSGAADAVGQMDGATAEQARQAAQAGVRRAKERLGPQARDVAAWASEQADWLQPKAADLQQQARERATALTRQARERAAAVAERARDQAPELTDRASELAEQAGDRASGLAEQAKDWLIPTAALLVEKAATVGGKKDDLMAQRDDVAEQARSRAVELGGQARERAMAIQGQAGPAVQQAAGETAAAIGDAFDATGRAVRSTVNNIFWIIVLGGLAVLLYAPKDEEREKLFAEVREWVTYAIDLISELRGGK